MPGVLGPEQDAGDHEERDGRQPDPAPQPGQEPAASERAAEGDELVTHVGADDVRAEAGQILWPTDHHEPVPGRRTSVGSGATIGTSSRRMAAIVMPVRCRTSSSAMVRPVPGESSRSVTQSMSRPPTTASISSTTGGLEVRATEDRPEGAGLGIGERQRQPGS